MFQGLSGRQSPPPRCHVRVRHGWRTLALVGTAAVVVAACGGGGGGSAAPSGSPSADASGAGTPKVGGTLSFGEFSPPVGLDPVVETGAGVTGLIESTAVYDTLLRYNYDTGKYDPGTALSATPNADNTEWTIKLRPGVKFSDGTAYDADAVVFGLNRFRIGGEGAPPCADVRACPGPVSVSLAPYVKDITAVDATTVKVTLTQAWGSFPVLLATEPGLIPSPAAVKKCPESGLANQCSFNTAPVGAGPFKVTSFKPGEAITMVRNPDYWGGQVYLDGITFTSQRDGGAAKTLDALKTGQTQIAFLRDPVSVAAAHDAGYDGFSNRQYIGSTVLWLNVGNPAAATSNLKVRQAVAAAIDPQVINQRAFQGKADATSELFPKGFKWYPDVPGPAYDPDKARQLVSEAKAEGWNGHVRVLAANAPSTSNAGLALQAMLQNVGMDVALDNTKDSATTQGQINKGDFEIAFSGFNVTNDDWSQVALSALISTSTRNRTGIKDPALDEGFRELYAASTDAQKTAAWKKIATEINAQVPVLSQGTLEEFIAWSDKVHGVQPGLRTSVHLDKAWLS